MFSISETLSRRLSESLSATRCSAHTLHMCRDDTSALVLKFAAIGCILAAGVVGIAIPLICSRRRSGCLSPDSNLFVAAKAFAAGVILATGFVHMLPDASGNLTSPCLPIYPWRKFPFSGFLAMCSALVTLVVDFAGTQIFERKQGKEKMKGVMMGGDVVVGGLNSVSESGIMPVDRVINRVDGSVNGGGMHIVGMYAHADRHGHNHPPKKGEEGAVLDIEGCHRHHNHGESDSEGDGGQGHGHSHGLGGDGGRHAVVSQVLELGIVSHSVIIGLSVGVSHSPCAIRPLIAALSFHQFFEGFALGGCISEARFKTFKTTLMACFFALTTPSGIGIGISIAKSYDSGSARALAIEGVLDSISAGILIYMSLVDLIAADFMSKKMRCNLRLQIVSYFALFSGAILMSSLAIWS